jgi:arginyl-tRNA synthetase
VYSFKKCANADLVFNVIASEQNLPQEKVVLTMQLLHPQAQRRLYHISYELVKLAAGDQELKMSGRRGRYVLADDLFVQFKQEVIKFMRVKRLKKEAENKGAVLLTPEEELLVGAEVATAAMKYSLLSTPPRHQIAFDVLKAADPDEVSGPFLLYNAVRFKSLIRKFEDRVANGTYPPLPPLSEVDFSLLNRQVSTI